MSNFSLKMPTYLESSWSQLIRDGSFDRKDLATLKQAAAGQTGSKIQEALEIQTLDTLEQKLNLDQDASLKLDKVQVQPNQGLGHAILEVSLLPDAPAPASAKSPTPTAAAAEPSSEDMIWAANIEVKLKQQQPVVPEDVERYKSICQRFLDSRKGKPAPTLTEMRFANSVQRKQLSGQQPTPAEISRFQDINARQALHIQAESLRQPALNRPPNQQEIQWAENLQMSMQTKDYLPSIEENVKFLRIVQAHQQFGSQPAAQPPQQPVKR